MKIDVKTESGNVLRDIECGWDLSRPKTLNRLDARELKLTVDRRVPINQYNLITATDDGMVKARCYAESNDIDIENDSKTTWACPGVEGLLNTRFAPDYFYPMDDVDFGKLFADTLTNGVVPGLIAIANSIPPRSLPYTIYDATRSIIKLAGYGKTSFWGTRNLFIGENAGAKQLTDSITLAALTYTECGFFRDDDDIYIRIEDLRSNGWYLLGGLLIENAYDTTVRLGEVADSTQTLNGDLETSLDEMGDLIADCIYSSGFFLRIRDDANYTYIDIMKTDGRGSERGLYTIREGETGFCSIGKSTASDPKVHGIVGIGMGGNYYGKEDTTYTGLRAYEKFEVENGFRDDLGILISKIDTLFAARQIDSKYNIGSNKIFQMYPGDYIKFYPKDAPPLVLSSFSIEESSSGVTSFELGAKTIDFVDVEDARNSFPRGFTDKYLRDLNDAVSKTGTFYLSDPEHKADACELEYYVPPGITDTKNNPRVTLSISLSKLDSIENWESPHDYVAGDEVYQEKDDDIRLYRCILAHAAITSRKPGHGINWETYWVDAFGVKDIEFGRCAVEMTIEATIGEALTPTVYEVPEASFVARCIGSGSLPEIDITKYLAANETNTVKLWVHMEKEYAEVHTEFADHPELSVSANMKFYKRLSI
jgi:hypothetical protein